MEEHDVRPFLKLPCLHLLTFCLVMQERLASSAVTRRSGWSTTEHMRDYARQFHPTKNNCDCAQAVMKCLKAAAITTQLEGADAANVNIQEQTWANDDAGPATDHAAQGLPVAPRLAYTYRGASVTFNLPSSEEVLRDLLWTGPIV